MLIVDSQVHLAEEHKSDWIDIPVGGLDLDERRRRGPRFHWKPDVHDLLHLMDENGIDATVLVTNLVDGQPEHEPALEAARDHPDRFAVIGRITSDKDNSIAALETWRDIPEMLGLRMSFRPTNNNLDEFTRGDYDWLWDVLVRLDIPVNIHAPGLLDHVARIAANHPGLRVVVDHGGLGSETLDDDIRPQLGPVLDLARFENVALKASALPCVTTEQAPFPQLKDVVHRFVDAYGPSRVFWGSDVSRLPCRLDTLLSFFLDELDFLSEADLAEVMGAGLVRWMGWTRLEQR